LGVNSKKIAIVFGKIRQTFKTTKIGNEKRERNFFMKIIEKKSSHPREKNKHKLQIFYNWKF
jgi:hypothetical protein